MTDIDNVILSTQETSGAREGGAISSPLQFVNVLVEPVTSYR
jgi:hypothetical protein